MTPRPRKYETEEERKEARRESVRKCREKQKERMYNEITGYIMRIEELERVNDELEEQLRKLTDLLNQPVETESSDGYECNVA
jgi:hypothetical protein